MRLLFTEIRPEERNNTLYGALTLFFIMVTHGLLETARDALFVSKVAAEKLPWVYLAVAILTLIISFPGRQRPGRERERRTLLTLQLATALITMIFGHLIQEISSAWIYYTLYVWSSAAFTLIQIRTWLLFSEVFTASQAKRTYAVIGVGGALGITVGYAVAGVLLQFVSVEFLVVASAGLGGASAFLPWFLFAPPRHEQRLQTNTDGFEPPEFSDGFFNPKSSAFTNFKTVTAHPYVRKVAATVFLSTLTLTAGDYLFKSAVSRNIAPAAMGTFFATSYFIFNILSVTMLAFVVTPFIRRYGVTWALFVLPVALGFTGLGVILGGGFIAVMALRGADGALRFSLHRTATELLYLPMSAIMRESARTLIEVTCQRGGQAVASLMILALLSFNGNTAVIAALILVSVAISIFNTSGLGKHYLNVFRGTLGQIGNNTRISSSELDMASLETLIAALNRPEDQEVLGAMEILAGKGRGRLIPALILYHPSPLVVIRALEIFIQDERDDFIPMVDKLIDHPDPMVRSAAVRTRAAAVPDRQWLQKRRNHECLAVDVTVVANLVARDWIEPEEAKETLYKAVHSEDPEPRVALAKAAQAVSHAVFEQPLRKLINDKVSEVRIEAIRAVSHAGAVGYLSELVPLLADRAVRETVRQALLGAGEPALQYLDACLSDPSTTPEVRRHIPRTISRFPVEAAARILLKHLPTVSGGMVRYKILRGLGKLINRDPDLKLDREVLRRVLEINLKRNYQLLQWRLDLEKGQAKEAFSLTSSGRLLVQLLRDKEHYAIERLFRLLDLLHPHEDIRRIYRGLHSLNPQVRSSSLELLGNLLSPPYRLTVMGLVDATDDQQRLVAAEHILPSRSNDYAEVVRRLLKNESHALRALAIYHAVELNLIGLEDSAAVMDLPGNGHLGRLREHVLAMLAAKSCAGDKGPSQ